MALIVCLFLALAVWTVFGQTLHHQFVNFDDDTAVYENPVIKQGLGRGSVAWAFTHTVNANWQPLTTLSHMLDCQLYGLHPAGHHLTNILLHAATAILLFFVLTNMTGTFWRCAFVAAVFAIHPLRVESVAWVSERKDVLSGFFFMLTLWAYVRFVRNKALNPQRSTLNYILALLFFALGLMSKPMLVTGPFVLLLLDYWPLERMRAQGNDHFHSPLSLSLPRLLLEKIPFLLLTVADCAGTMLAQRHAIRRVADLDFGARIGNALVAYASYLGQMFYPAGLAVMYPHPGKHLSPGLVGAAVVILIIISTAILLGRKKYPWLLVGWLWYLGMLVPVIGLMQVGEQARADRFTYLPQIGLYLIVAWAVVQFCGRWRGYRIVLGSVATVILFALMTVAHVQATYWQDSVSLWKHTLACTSGNYSAHLNLGAALAGQKKWSEAIEQYQKAIQLCPELATPHFDLANALADEGHPDEAIPCYERALQLKPDYAEAQLNLGNAFSSQGNLTEAIIHFQKAIELNQNFASAHNNLACAFLKQGSLPQAIAHFQRALQIAPDFIEARVNLAAALALEAKSPVTSAPAQPDDAVSHFKSGNAAADLGQYEEAAQHYRRALQLAPDYSAALSNLGAVLVDQGKLDEAVQTFGQLLKLTPDNAEAHNNLGSVLARQGQMAQAIPYFERSLQLKPDYAEAAANLAHAQAARGK